MKLFNDAALTWENKKIEHYGRHAIIGRHVPKDGITPLSDETPQTHDDLNRLTDARNTFDSVVSDALADMPAELDELEGVEIDPPMSLLELNTAGIYVPPSESHPGWEDEDEITRGHYIPVKSHKARYGDTIPELLDVLNYPHMDHPKIITLGNRHFVYNDPDAGMSSRAIPPLDWVTVGYFAYGGGGYYNIEIEEELVWYGQRWQPGQTVWMDYFAVRAPYLWAFFSIPHTFCVWTGWIGKHQIEIASKLASESPPYAHWISNNYAGSSAWDTADAHLYAQRNLAQMGIHTEAMCIEGGMNPWMIPPNFYYDGCKIILMRRMAQNFSHPGYKMQRYEYPRTRYYWMVLGAEVAPPIYACKPPKTPSIVPSLCAFGALTMMSMLGPLAAMATATGQGAGRRTPRRK